MCEWNIWTIFIFLRYMGRCFDSFLSVTGIQLRNDTRWCQCHMNFSLSMNKISGDAIYLNNILIKLCSVINAHGFHVCRHMILVPNRSTKDNGVARKKVPILLAHIFHVAGWKAREDFTCKRHVSVRIGRGLGHSRGLTEGHTMRCCPYSSVTMSLSIA